MLSKGNAIVDVVVEEEEGGGEEEEDSVGVAIVERTVAIVGSAANEASIENVVPTENAMKVRAEERVENIGNVALHEKIISAPILIIAAREVKEASALNVVHEESTTNDMKVREVKEVNAMSVAHEESTTNDAKVKVLKEASALSVVHEGSIINGMRAREVKEASATSVAHEEGTTNDAKVKVLKEANALSVAHEESIINGTRAQVLKEASVQNVVLTCHAMRAKEVNDVMAVGVADVVVCWTIHLKKLFHLSYSIGYRGENRNGGGGENGGWRGEGEYRPRGRGRGRGGDRGGITNLTR